MKLESKLGLTTGVLICAMLLSAFTATMRIQEANHLASSATTQHIPINAATRDLRIQLVYSIHALESYMLFGIDPASAANFRKARQGDLAGKDLDHLYGSDQIGTLAVAMQKMQSSLGSIIGTVVDTAGSLTGSAA